MGIVIGLDRPISPVTPIKVDGVNSPAPHEDTKGSGIKDKLGVRPRTESCVRNADFNH
jgi:hypothetical protein